MTCNHDRTVQVFASIFKCTDCGELVDSHDERLRPNADHYEELQRSKAASIRRAIERNRRTKWH